MEAIAVPDGLSYRSNSDSLGPFTVILVSGAGFFLLMLLAVIGYTCMAHPVGKKKSDIDDEENGMETALSAKSRLNNSKKSLVTKSARHTISTRTNKVQSSESEAV